MLTIKEEIELLKKRQSGLSSEIDECCRFGAVSVANPLVNPASSISVGGGKKYEISINDSIRRILLTPIGTRVMLPEFGSRLWELIDKEIDDEWIILAIEYTYEAIEKWEERVEITRVMIEAKERAKIVLYYKIEDAESMLEISLEEFSC